MYVDGGTCGGRVGAETDGRGDAEGVFGECGEEAGSEEVQSGAEEIDGFRLFCEAFGRRR